MRMWMVDPGLMCVKHLLGEHVEMHMFLGTIKKGKKLDGYVRNNLLQFRSIVSRHSELANEMSKRGMTHKSELNQLPETNYPYFIKESIVTKSKASEDLFSRCPECRNRLFTYLKEVT